MFKKIFTYFMDKIWKFFMTVYMSSSLKGDKYSLYKYGHDHLAIAWYKVYVLSLISQRKVACSCKYWCREKKQHVNMYVHMRSPPSLNKCKIYYNIVSLYLRKFRFFPRFFLSAKPVKQLFNYVALLCSLSYLVFVQF